jgi:hypothetical protein
MSVEKRCRNEAFVDGAAGREGSRFGFYGFSEEKGRGGKSEQNGPSWSTDVRATLSIVYHQPLEPPAAPPP